MHHGRAKGRVGAGLRDQIVWRLLVATALIHLLFAIWPSIDIAVSRAFFQSDGTFWLSKSGFAELVRMPIWLASVALAIIAAIMLCVSFGRGPKAQTDWRLWAFVTALYVTGPGLLVNVLLKQNWGRARPMTIEAFGGDKLFTPPFEIAGQCASNCSFVSGEAASAAVMAIVLAVFFCNNLGKPAKAVVFAGLVAVFVLASGLRVATGRHFLSDVVFAGLIMLILARLFYRAFGVTLPNRFGFLEAMRTDVMGVISAMFRFGGGNPSPEQDAAIPVPVLPEMEGTPLRRKV